MYTENTIVKLVEYIHPWRNIEGMLFAIYITYSKTDGLANMYITLKGKTLNFYMKNDILSCRVHETEKYDKIRLLGNNSNNKIETLYFDQCAFSIEFKDLFRSYTQFFSDVKLIYINNYDKSAFNLLNIIFNDCTWILDSALSIYQLIGLPMRNVKKCKLVIKHFNLPYVNDMLLNFTILDFEILANFNMVKDASGMFKNSICRIIKGLRLDNVLILDNIFYNCNDLYHLDLFDGHNITSMTNAFKGCYSLTEFDGIRNLSCDIDLSDCKSLSRNSIASIFANLLKTKELHTIYLHPFTYRYVYKIDEEYLKAKNWRISSKKLYGVRFNESYVYVSKYKATEEMMIEIEYVPISDKFYDQTVNIGEPQKIKFKCKDYYDIGSYLSFGNDFDGYIHRIKIFDSEQSKYGREIQCKIWNKSINMYDVVNDEYSVLIVDDENCLYTDILT